MRVDYTGLQGLQGFSRKGLQSKLLTTSLLIKNNQRKQGKEKATQEVKGTPHIN
jgi:hypothetical protein